MTHHPPALAVRLLRWRLPPEWQDFILGDLEEEFRLRADTSPAAARRWFWRQAIRCAAAPPKPNNATRPFHLVDRPGDPFMRAILSDIRHALRVFIRTPSYALAVAAVLALGIGANTAIFSIVNAVLLRPLPFEQPDRLVRVFHVPPQTTFPGMETFPLSPANFLDYQRESSSFEAMAAYNFRQLTLTGTGNAEALRVAVVGPDFFRIVRTQPTLGRTFVAEEYDPARAKVVVISEGFWRSHLGAAPDTVGRTLTFDGQTYTVVGVMPKRFSMNAWGATMVPMWAPLAWTDKDRTVRENHNYQGIARLKPGVDLAQAKSELQVISKRLEQAYPAENAGWGGTAIPLQELIVGDIRRSLLMLLAAVALVLLIACANVGNLILARSMNRRKEIAIRAVLGAGRRRVFQHLLVESLVLSIAGGAAGLLLAQIVISGGASLVANQVPRAEEASVDVRVLLFVLAASILTGILAGLVPALRAGRTDLNDTLKEGGRSDASGAGSLTRRALIVAEVALSLMLLMGAGVMIRSLQALRHVDAGFNPRSVLKMDLNLPDARYKEPAQRRAFYDALMDRLGALPRVQSAGWVDTLPVTGGGSVQPLVIEGRAELNPREQPTVSVRVASAGYMKTMEIPMLRGRDFRSGDEHALLVSASAAKLLWGDTDPVGRRATLPLISRTRTIEVVGVVGDVKEQLAEKAPPTVYYYMRDLPFGDASVALRTSADPESVARAAVAAVHAMDAQLPVQAVHSMDEVIEETLVNERFRALLLEAFAAAALMLASVGIYSVLSYLVRGRRREIGIRTALGARTSDVLRLVLLEGLKPALLGIAIGTAGALLAAGMLDKLVFGVKASDPLTLAVVAGALLLVSIAASLLPAWRATKLDPLTILRDS
ncbi:MAG TPA: ADOP family duplicated permease [Vicinamibacterales bacterium]|nr:ADOP family duplicated permease [Vicinamibacterales bacterium]